MLECDYICSNFCYRKNNTKIFDAYKILTLGNIKIGFIGVVTPQTLIKHIYIQLLMRMEI